MLSFCLGMLLSVRVREYFEFIDFLENSDQGLFSNGSYYFDFQAEESEEEREEEEGFVIEIIDIESEVEYFNNRVFYVIYNIYINYIYSVVRFYQS